MPQIWPLDSFTWPRVRGHPLSFGNLLTRPVFSLPPPWSQPVLPGSAAFIGEWYLVTGSGSLLPWGHMQLSCDGGGGGGSSRKAQRFPWVVSRLSLVPARARRRGKQDGPGPLRGGCVCTALMTWDGQVDVCVAAGRILRRKSHAKGCLSGGSRLVTRPWKSERFGGDAQGGQAAG